MILNREQQEEVMDGAFKSYITLSHGFGSVHILLGAHVHKHGDETII